MKKLEKSRNQFISMLYLRNDQFNKNLLKLLFSEQTTFNDLLVELNPNVRIRDLYFSFKFNQNKLSLKSPRLVHTLKQSKQDIVNKSDNEWDKILTPESTSIKHKEQKAIKTKVNYLIVLVCCFVGYIIIIFHSFELKFQKYWQIGKKIIILYTD